MTQFGGLLLTLAFGSDDSQTLQAARPGRGNLFAAAPYTPQGTELFGMLERRFQAGATGKGALAFAEASTASGDHSVTLGYRCAAGAVHSTIRDAAANLKPIRATNRWHSQPILPHGASRTPVPTRFELAATRRLDGAQSRTAYER